MKQMFEGKKGKNKIIATFILHTYMYMYPAKEDAQGTCIQKWIYGIRCYMIMLSTKEKLYDTQKH